MSLINQFISKVKGLARPNLFRITIPEMGEDFQFFCKASKVPSRTITPISVNYLNKIIKIRGDDEYTNWNTQIILDADYTSKKLFEEWLEKIQSAEDITGADYLVDYSTTVLVEHLSSAGEVIAAFELYNAWPLSTPEIALDFGTRSSLITLNVDWVFSHYKAISFASNATLG